jgi:hypothetical protein
MKKILLICFVVVGLIGSEIHLSKKDAQYIAKKVWQNEGAGLDKYLIWWNDGEDFASLGIGHFIWFPPHHTERFREVFPMVLEYIQSRGVKLPMGLTPDSDFPWSSKKAFFWAKKSNSKTYRTLFKFLKDTQIYQAEFMANRLKDAIPQILSTIDDKSRAREIKRRFDYILFKDNKIDKRGLYILIDYLNFKGEGTLKSERYNNQGWGLLQVLEHLDMSDRDKYRAFANSAKAMLERRIKNSPKQRGEKRWRRGWFKRLDTYYK